RRVDRYASPLVNGKRRISCRSSRPTPAARNRRPHVCLRSCTRTRLNPSGAVLPNPSWYRAAARRRAAFQPELFRRVKRWLDPKGISPTNQSVRGRNEHQSFAAALLALTVQLVDSSVLFARDAPTILDSHG